MKKVLVVVGHSFYDKGAYNSKLDLKEYDFCMDVACEVFKREQWKDIDLLLKSRNASYSVLPAEINSLNPDFILELHLNCVADSSVQGTEHLYFNASQRSREMASILQKHCLEQFKLKDRKIKALFPGDNGYNIVSKTNAPCVITEPFFLSNITKEQIGDFKEKYIKYLTKAIREIVDTL